MDLKESRKTRETTNCVIKLQKSFVTPTQGALIVNGVLEHFLHFSGHIPTAFPLFKDRVKRAINERENVSENVSWSSHQNLRHIQAARQVVEDMAVIKENVIQEFKKTEILEAVIALGSSIFSAKKMLKIHLPSINQNHHCVIHENSNNSIVRHLMMSLASSPELTDFNGNASKVFLLLKKSVQPEDVISQVDFFQRMPGFQVPSKCKTTCLEILLNESETNQNGGCCKLMKICADVSNLSITELNELNDSQKIIEYDWYIASISIKGLKQSDIIF